MRLSAMTAIAMLMLGAAGTAGLASERITVANVPPHAVTSETQTLRASAAFRAGLALLDDGEAAAAFEAAARLPNEAERRTLEWAAINYQPRLIEPAAIARFMGDAPEFAADALFQRRLEDSLVAHRATPQSVREALDGRTAQTLEAQILLARAALDAGEETEAHALARGIWTGTILSDAQERDVLRRFATVLTPDDHWARVQFLLMHDRIRAAERLGPHLSDMQRALVAARAATARGESNGRQQLDRLDRSLATNPVYIFTRVQRARAAGLEAQAVEWLERAPASVPAPGLWYAERAALSRSLLNAGEPALAYRALAGLAEGSPIDLVTGHFSAGYIALSFLDDAEAARRHFLAMADTATMPESVSKAQFWLARAEIALGNFEAADRAYGAAAQFPTIYYGQLARGELGLAGVPIRPLPATDAARPLFDALPVPRGVRLLVAAGERGKALTLLRQWGTGLQDEAQAALAAALAQDIGAHNVAIAIADAGGRRGLALDAFSYPRAGLPRNASMAADTAAVYAITRQESLFQLDAVSHAGARGLMQLMPGTARETAERLGVSYSANRLVTDAQYNILLGSTYLSDQLRRYDGSLLLAAAAYNAGPGNANRWIRAYGDPRAGNVDPVVWVELIPFSETRSYVQRVLGNYLTYRARLGQDPVAVADALRRIP